MTCDHCGGPIKAGTGYHEAGCHLCATCDERLLWNELKAAAKPPVKEKR